MNLIEKVTSSTLADLPDAEQRIVEEGRAALDERLDKGKPINASGAGDRGAAASPRSAPKPGKDRDR